ncbi:MULTISPECIES: S8 family peptidase [unclassified Arcicella]|uniref:S8 family peptidase n=1 Tax=unclassified Arcicella TaxID=2644986 RepID=UPI002856FFB8|nr:MULTISPECIES: S8 family peptidase [unclassified Arcicella]MDR6561635.1 subtilisin family serine protease [Arcicella sp. BE51]MDR6812415.1 subtilisin family serine protease [Arcicella sp. BE140]MDR6823813.1 subtilisin family serine protease [Arcicella sp. BE139]
MNIISKLSLIWLIFLFHVTNAQYLEPSLDRAPSNWFNLDFLDDKVRGISTEKAYRDILRTKKSKPVIVAIIDSGVDILHEDLCNKIWVNTKEIPNNGIDDDNNGYIDDIHGWDFLGNKAGEDIAKESLEITREFARLQKKYQAKVDVEKLSASEKEEYNLYKKYKLAYESKVSEVKEQGTFVINLYHKFIEAKFSLCKHLGVKDITKEELTKIGSKDTEELKKAKRVFELILDLGQDEAKLREAFEYYDTQLNYGINLTYNPRDLIGDDVNNIHDRNYGNNEVKGPDAHHGTHVAGIVAANRNNDLGIAGVADNVQIMVVRALPDGDERDKDVVNAILYAVENGAKVINMSFGKTVSPQKSAVDDAVKFAQSKGVLLIHAAGNENEDIDTKENYPTKRFLDGGEADNWIEVGATSWMQSPNTVAEFSNYGQKTVDVFAPGVDIQSTVVGSKYEDLSGTSMAAPVVSGLAALLISYYPELDYKQIKQIILESSIKLTQLKVARPGSSELIEFGKLSTSGGIVNAYEAVKMAEKIKENTTKN